MNLFTQVNYKMWEMGYFEGKGDKIKAEKSRNEADKMMKELFDNYYDNITYNE